MPVSLPPSDQVSLDCLREEFACLRPRWQRIKHDLEELQASTERFFARLALGLQCRPNGFSPKVTPEKRPPLCHCRPRPVPTDLTTDPLDDLRAQDIESLPGAVVDRLIDLLYHRLLQEYCPDVAEGEMPSLEWDNEVSVCQPYLALCPPCLSPLHSEQDISLPVESSSGDFLCQSPCSARDFPGDKHTRFVSLRQYWETRVAAELNGQPEVE